MTTGKPGLPVSEWTSVAASQGWAGLSWEIFQLRSARGSSRWTLAWSARSSHQTPSQFGKAVIITTNSEMPSTRLTGSSSLGSAWSPRASRLRKQPSQAQVDLERSSPCGNTRVNIMSFRTSLAFQKRCIAQKGRSKIGRVCQHFFNLSFLLSFVPMKFATECREPALQLRFHI